MTHRAEWSPDEDALLIQLRRFDRAPVETIAAELGRTVEAVYARCGKLGILVMERKEWDAAETARLKALFADGLSCAAIARELDRSAGSTRWKIEELGLSRPGASGRWSEDETATLIAMHAEEASTAAIAAATGRTPAGVKEKARQLGLAEPGKDPWDAEDDARLRAAADGASSVAALAEDLGRSEAAIRSRAHKLGVRLAVAGSAWTEADRKVLADTLADGGTVEEAAAALLRSKRAVRIMATELGLLEKTGPRTLDAAAKARIREKAATLSVTAVARELGHDVRTLKLVAQAEGFAFAAGRTPAVPKAPKPKAERTVRQAAARRIPTPRPVAAKPAPQAPVRRAPSAEVSKLAARFLAFRSEHAHR